MTTWQIAAGDGNTDYADVFLKFGVILVGPGNGGEYFEKEDAYLKKPYYRSWMKRFAEEISEGDRVILKRPNSRNQWKIIAVGEVISEYKFHEVFSYVEGWDLQHYRRVTWKVPNEDVITDGLTRGTLSRAHQKRPLEKAEKIWKSGTRITPSEIPELPKKLGIDQLIDALMKDGYPEQDAKRITGSIWQLREIAEWYRGKYVGEHEIRTFLIVPLLISLGWEQKKIKIEWEKIDVTLFEAPYSGQNNPFIVIESKKLPDGLHYAPQQATWYAERYPSCKTFIVSDGIRYKLFKLEEKGWRQRAYMNLLEMRESYPYDKEVEGAVEFFLQMLPRGSL